MIDVAFSTRKLLVALPPKDTELAPIKFVPVMLTPVPPVVGPVDGVTKVTVGRAYTLMNVTCVEVLLPPEFVAVRLIDQLPTPNVAVAFLFAGSNVNHVLFPGVRFLAPQYQLVGGPVDVSLKNIVNGAIPAQPCPVLLVAYDVVLLVEVKDATTAGADKLIHVT